MNILAIAVVAVSLGQAQPSLDKDFDTALEPAGLSTKTARFDPNLVRFFGGGEFTTSFFQSCIENPWRIPFFADVERRDLSTMAGHPNDSLSVGARLLGFSLRRTLLGDPIKPAEDESAKTGALAGVLSDMKRAGLIRGAVPSVSSVPPAAQHAATLVLRTMLNMAVYRQLAFQDIDLPTAYKFVAGLSPGNNDDLQGADFDRLYQICKKVDMRYLLTGGHDLTLASQVASEIAKTAPHPLKYDFAVETQWGVIRLHGGEPTTYGNVPTLLVIDTGGDDTYLNVPSNTGPTNWASVVIDTDGNDKYLSDAGLATSKLSAFEPRKSAKNAPGPAGALFGYSVLIDTNGDDLYRSDRPGLGSGRFGVGVLLDEAGTDTYDGYCDSEGFGNFGIGILEDDSGDDHYDAFLQSQGCGQTMGFGYLVDRTGNDSYVANDTTIDFPSAQSAEHNTNMSQGAGNGRRADYLESHALSGGIGILFDAAGNDHYSCGVFGQGTGYWNGVGMLWDSAGSDDYTGLWYVQGAAAHFAVGYLEDLSGDDHYSAAMNMAQGAGHDFSIGMLVDQGGTDHFSAPNLSLGAGNANGIGIFVKTAGAAQYEMFRHEDPKTHAVTRAGTGLSLGKAAESPANSLRWRSICLGAFLDLTGAGTYPTDATWAKTGNRVANWTAKGTYPEESQVGVFWAK
jgi:hypothetical protein